MKSVNTIRIADVVNQLQTLQMQCLAMAKTVDIILSSLSRPIEEEDPKTCRHPIAARKSTAVMGHPRRFLCMQCNEEVDPDAQTVQERGPVNTDSGGRTN